MNGKWTEEEKEIVTPHELSNFYEFCLKWSKKRVIQSDVFWWMVFENVTVFALDSKYKWLFLTTWHFQFSNSWLLPINLKRCWCKTISSHSSLCWRKNCKIELCHGHCKYLLEKKVNGSTLSLFLHIISWCPNVMCFNVFAYIS